MSIKYVDFLPNYRHIYNFNKLALIKFLTLATLSKELWDYHFMTNIEFTIIGAGPAAICAIPALVARGVDPKKILWIDSGGFNVGAFGSTLSAGSSLPGNTSVESYQRVNNAIYEIFADCRPNQTFLMDTLPKENTCYLKVAAEPIQYISNYLRNKVNTIADHVTNILETNSGLKIIIENKDGIAEILTDKCILAIGADPKTLKLAKIPELTFINDPNITFIESKLTEYLSANPAIKHIAVIGSSHSAALATMNLLNANIKVSQFMNKPYKYAEPCIATDGTKYTKHDNTGLKGMVASFTKNLFIERHNKFKAYIESNPAKLDSLISNHISASMAVVAAIGYKTAATLKINNQSIDCYTYNHQTTEFNAIKGLYGLGIAFPVQTTALDGEIEYSVGYGKFWSTVNNPRVVQAWLGN